MFVSKSYFIEELGINEKTVKSFINRNKDEDFIKGNEIDLNHLVFIKDEKIRLLEVAHEYYYWLTKYFTVSKLAISLSEYYEDSKIGWRSYLYYKLFELPNYELLKLYISTKLIGFIRYAEDIIPEIKKELKYGYRTTNTKENDKLSRR